MSTPAPMAADRLAKLRSMATGCAEYDCLVDELLADRDYQERRAQQAEAEHDEAREAHVRHVERLALAEDAAKRARDAARIEAASLRALAGRIGEDLPEQALAKILALQSEVARLRARVRVEAADVERHGVVDAAVLRYVVARGWTLGTRYVGGSPRVDLVIVSHDGNPIAPIAEHDTVTCSGASIAFIVGWLANLESRSSWTILEEMSVP